MGLKELPKCVKCNKDGFIGMPFIFKNKIPDEIVEEVEYVRKGLDKHNTFLPLCGECHFKTMLIIQDAMNRLRKKLIEDALRDI